MKGKILHSKTDELANTHAEKLPEMVQNAMHELGISYGQLQAIGISSGPGSYTGLRIGTSLAKGICFACEIPLMALNAFLGLAFWAKEQVQGDIYISNLDARRDEIYEAQFDKNLELLSPTTAKILVADTYPSMDNKKYVFCGNANDKIASICKINNEVVFLPSTPHAGFMVNEAIHKYENQLFEDLAYFEPFYLKEFVPGIAKKFSL
jgi:tRNA threonylcarbamoyladenosine biosynthesis protein TsaB